MAVELIPAQHLPNPAATLQAGQEFAQRLRSDYWWQRWQQTGLTIHLHGDLGVGKTTWVRGLLQGLGHGERVKSPSYSLLELYEINGQTVAHFDLYRIPVTARYSQFFEAGFEEHLRAHSLCLIEWPSEQLPCHLHVHLAHIANADQTLEGRNYWVQQTFDDNQTNKK